MKHHLLYIAREPQVLNSGGAEVDQRNLRILREIFGEENVIVEFLPKTTLKSVANSLLTLSSYGVSHKQEKYILQLHNRYHFNFAFIEGSFCGKLVYGLTRHGCKVIIHMHNIEAKLYKDRLINEKGFISLIRYRYIKYNENLSIKYATAIINLNDRDKNEMLKSYGRKSDLILPITFPRRNVNRNLHEEGKFILFVGSNFFPNIEGIIWFIRNVAPNVKTQIKIVGGCCKNPLLINEPHPSNVELVGYVDDLNQYYSDSFAVIAPIFSGSGMKTKTIEAMSYGKTILGTDEAFVGIKNPDQTVGVKCNTAEEFIKAINNLDRLKVNVQTLRTFESSFTDDVFKIKLCKFLSAI